MQDARPLTKKRIGIVMAIKELPDIETINNLLIVDVVQGIMTWRERTPDYYMGKKRPPDWALKSWNAKNAGNLAFNGLDNNGYLRGQLLGVYYQAHRMIFFVATGLQPRIIDHRNGKKSDNRFENLRPSNHSSNAINSKLRVGSSEYRGVSWCKRDSVWVAQIRHDNKRERLGNFKSEVEAAKAYDNAAIEYHGEFATFNFPKENPND